MKKVASALVLVAILTGCQGQARDDEAAKLIELQTELNAVKARIDRVESTNASLVLDTLTLKMKSDGVAIIDPANATGYSMMSTSVGPLLLSLENVQPLADGSQVIINAGNPHAVSLLGIELKVKYGSRLKEGGNYLEWSNGLATKDVSIAQSLYAGSWTPIKFSLPVKPDQLGHIEIAGDINRVALTPR